MRAALERGGVTFLENGKGPGVRLRKAPKGASAASLPVEDDLNNQNDE
jgi:hypothetical protein